MGNHAAPGSGAWRWVGGLAVAVLVGALLVHDALADDPEPGGGAAPQPSAEPSGPPPEQAVVAGSVLLPKPTPTEKPSEKPSEQPSEPPAPQLGTVTTAVANIPNRTGDSAFASSMRTLVSPGPDFVMLNEVGRHPTDQLRSLAPGYDAYREEQRDNTPGGVSQSLNNVVMWRAADWSLVDAGRVKLVDDDQGYQRGQPYTWDRYATWTTLRQADGAVVSVISTHQMTNPARYPQQHGHPRLTRAQQYGRGMDVLVGLVRDLAAQGPVLVGGDMNTHGNEGPWTAQARMSAAGYGFAKDSAVMYLFYPSAAHVLSNREVRVVSDHPAIVTTVDMSGL